MGIMEAIRKGFGIGTRSIGLVLILFIFNAVWAVGSIPLIPTPAPLPPAAAPALAPAAIAPAPATGAAASPAPAATPVPFPAPAPLPAAAYAFAIVFMLVSIFMQGGTIGVVRDHIKTGSTLLGKFASYGLKYYLRLFLLGLFIIFVVLIVALIAATLIVSTVPLKQAAVTVIASVIATALGIAGIYFILLLTLAPYSMVSNEAGLIAGIKNSIRVVKGSFWKILALLLLLILISLGVGFVAGFITGIVTIALPMKAGQVIIGLVNSIFNSYLGIVMIGAFMSMYLALSQTVPVASTAIPPAPPPPPPKGASV